MDRSTGMRKRSAAAGRSRKKQTRLLFLLLFPAVTFYMEIVFKMATVKNLFTLSPWFILLFSLSLGCVGILLTTMFKNPTVNKGIKTGLLFFMGLIFLIEYFIYRQFKVFYDVNTSINGAGIALGGFWKDILRMIFSFGGILTIALMFLPGIWYAVWGRNIDRARPFKWQGRVLIAVLAVVLFLLARLTMLPFAPYRNSYKTEYNFHTCVENFGLLTGLRLDVSHIVAGGEEEFVIPDETETQTHEETVPPETGETPAEGETLPPAPVEYGYNQLDLDFEKLAASGEKYAKLDKYVGSLAATKQNQYTGLFKGKNLIFLSAEAFSGDIVSPELTPTLYRLIHKGIYFSDFYQPASAGTTGGEYQNIFGMLPTAGGKSMRNMIGHYNITTMGSQLNALGYYGKMYHNNTYTYYSRDETHVCLGYSDGYMGLGNGMEKLITHTWPESDLEMVQGTFPLYADKQPFNIYYMTVSGHSAYSRKSNAMSKKNWDRVENLPYSDAVKAYYACNLELEDALTWLVNALEEKGIADDTVICLCADHFPYGLDDDAALGKMPYLSELYGYNVVDYLHRDHNALILWSGSLEKMDPITVDTPVYSLDILPTLSNLFGVAFDSRLYVGRDVFSDAEPLVFNTAYDWKTDKGTYISSTGKFTPAEGVTLEDQDAYVKSIKTKIRNKMTYMKGVNENDYFKHVFGK